MDGQCGKGCPIADKVSRLENQLDEYQAQNGDSHREIYGRLNALETASAVIKVQYDSIIQKLDELARKVGDLEQKPGRRWDAVVGALIGAVVSGLAVYFMAKMGMG